MNTTQTLFETLNRIVSDSSVYLPADLRQEAEQALEEARQSGYRVNDYRMSPEEMADEEAYQMRMASFRHPK